MISLHGKENQDRMFWVCLPSFHLLPAVHWTDWNLNKEIRQRKRDDIWLCYDFPFHSTSEIFLTSLSQTSWRVKISPGLKAYNLDLREERSGFVEDQGKSWTWRKKPRAFQGLAWALGMFIIHFLSKGVGFCTHHYVIGVASVENEQQWQSHKQTGDYLFLFLLPK